MALFVFSFLLIYIFLKETLGFETAQGPLLEIKPSTISAGQNLGFYKVDDTLNLTCYFKNETILPDIALEWIVPSQIVANQNWNICSSGLNFIVLIIKNLQENDSGVYKCRAVHNGIPYFNSENSVKINVKNKKKECTDTMFQCSEGVCISKRYTCDGFNDCQHGEDESPNYCGPGNPCDKKLMCPEHRCIPFTWCCESNREPNCTTKIKHSCCAHVEKLTQNVKHDSEYQYEQQRFGDIDFLQTTVYTVIGCVMAFMFIVTIIVIAICRVHVRRTLLSRRPSVSRNRVLSRIGWFQVNRSNSLSFYDLDLCLNRAGLNNSDLMSMNPLLVTYSSNNGVQFIGRPVEPPPYCEVVTSPPKEGPPPSYASLENFQDLQRYRRNKTINFFSTDDAEVSNSDNLLPSSEQIIYRVVNNNSEEIAEVQNLVALETFEKSTKNNERSSTECSGSSSHCAILTSTSGGGQNNSSLGFTVLSSHATAKDDALNAEKKDAEKMQEFLKEGRERQNGNFML